MGEREIRGSVINGYLKYVEKTWGKAGLETCKKTIKVADIKIKDGEMYTNKIILELLKWISANYGIEKVKQAGNYTIKNLGLLSYLVRFSSMDSMLSRATDRFREAYRFGTVGYEMTDHGARVWMRDVSEIPEDCVGWIGGLQGLMDLTKTKGQVVKTKCRLKGDKHCEYMLNWK